MTFQFKILTGFSVMVASVGCYHRPAVHATAQGLLVEVLQMNPSSIEPSSSLRFMPDEPSNRMYFDLSGIGKDGTKQKESLFEMEFDFPRSKTTRVPCSHSVGCVLMAKGVDLGFQESAPSKPQLPVEPKKREGTSRLIKGTSGPPEKPLREGAFDVVTYTARLPVNQVPSAFRVFMDGKLVSKGSITLSK